MYKMDDDFGTTRIAKTKEELPTEEDWAGELQWLGDYKTCPMCGGDGENGVEVPCLTCGGSGAVPR